MENVRYMEVLKNSRPIQTGETSFSFTNTIHGDNGAGLGASHQTGWSGVVAKLIQIYGQMNAEQFLKGGIETAFMKGTKETVEKKVKS